MSKGIGTSKRKDRNSQFKIYSYKTRKSVINKCYTFIKYVKEKYKIRYLNELKKEYLQEFLEVKNYPKKTAESYKQAVLKLQKGYNYQNNTNLDFANIITNNQEKPKKKIMMSESIHDDIIKRAYQGKYENGLAFELSRYLGLRASEITSLRMKDFYISKNDLKGLYIHKSKGGRSRYLPVEKMSSKAKQILLKAYSFFEYLNLNERLFINKTESYQTTFRRIRNKITQNKYNYANIHSLRKEFAKNFFIKELVNNSTTKAKYSTTKMLGHNRICVLKNYVGDI